LLRLRTFSVPDQAHPFGATVTSIDFKSVTYNDLASRSRRADYPNIRTRGAHLSAKCL